MVAHGSVFTVDRGIWIFIIAIIYCIINGALCSNLAGKKGYKKTDVYWVLGFIFGIIGLIYVNGLPDLVMRDMIQMFFENQ
ncbi:MAG: hypothetical protein ACYCYI_07355 [Saccharofermentanales bacterium]